MAFSSFGGGFAGQGTLCGTLAVAAAAIGMVADADAQKEMVNELFNWYKEFPFPEYQPGGLDLPTSIAGSVLCLDSCGNYMEASGHAYGDPERKERCAGVAADVVKYTIGMLNKL
jgi:hypothetical protein